MKNKLLIILMLLTTSIFYAQVPGTNPVLKSTTHVAQGIAPINPSINQRYLNTNGNYYRYYNGIWNLDNYVSQTLLDKVDTNEVDVSSALQNNASNLTLIQGNRSDIDDNITNISNLTTAQSNQETRITNNESVVEALEGGTANQILAKASSTDHSYSWIDLPATGGSGGISNIIEDLTPELGGNLSLNSKLITGLSHFVPNAVTNAKYINERSMAVEDIEGLLQFIAADTGSYAGGLVLTSAPTTGNNKNWGLLMGGVNAADNFSIRYKETSSDNTVANFNGSEVMTFQKGGNVGVGIVAPTEKLEVVGNIKANQFKVSGQNDASNLLAGDGSLVPVSSLGGTTEIEAGENITINGDGSTGTPYVINAADAIIDWSTPVDSNIIPDTDFGHSLGSPSNRFAYTYANEVVASGRLVAPNIQVEATVNGNVPVQQGSFLYTAAEGFIFRDSGGLRYLNQLGSGSGLTTDQSNRITNAALDNKTIEIADATDRLLVASDLNYTSGTEIGRKKILVANNTESNFDLDNTFLVDNVIRLKTLGTGVFNVSPTGSVVINHPIGTGAFTLSGDGEVIYIQKEASNSYRVYANEDAIDFYAALGSNLYQENSGANGGTGVGSFTIKDLGTVSRVADAAFTGGTAIQIGNAGNQYHGSSLNLNASAVATWSGGAITQLDANDVYNISFELKKEIAANNAYYAIRLNNTGISEGSINTTSSTGILTFSQNFTIPSGGADLDNSRIDLLPNINTPFTGWLRIGNFKITKVTDN